MFERIIISLIIVVSNLVCFASSPSQGDKDVSMVISYLRDTTQALSIDEVNLIGTNKFETLENGIINLGRDNAVIWLRIDIDLRASTSTDYYLDLDYSLVDYIDFYFQESSNWEILQTGSQRAFSKRFLDYRFFVFPINAQNRLQTVYFKVKSENPLNFQVTLKPGQVFYQETNADEIIHGIFIGFVLLVMISNLIFYFSLKDRSFLIYVGYMFFTLGINLFLTGHIGKYLLQDVGGWQNLTFMYTFAITIILSIWFAYEFLDLKKEKILNRYFLAPIIVASFVMALITPWSNYSIINTIFELLTLVLLLIVIFTGFRRLRQGHRPAAFYIAAYVSYLIFVTPVILLSFNAFERNFLSVYGAELGVIFESFLLAVALGYRYNYEKQKTDKEKKAILEENLHLQKQLHSKLEKQVKERTIELDEALSRLSEQKEEIEQQKDNIADQNIRLEKLNESKTKFISILAHDVKGPINSLFSFSELLKNHIDSLSRNELVDLGKKLGNHTKNLFSLLENLLQWSRTQTGSIEVNPVQFDLFEAIEENVNLAQMLTQPKNLTIILEGESETVYADKNMFNTVLRNLIANAVKFSFPGEEIRILIETGRGEAILKVKDKGVGISPKVHKKLFDIATKHSTEGTSGEKGTGLGLKLCKEFVGLNGGQIWVESKFNEGATFCFSLPLAKNVTEVLKTKM